MRDDKLSTVMCALTPGIKCPQALLHHAVLLHIFIIRVQVQLTRISSTGTFNNRAGNVLLNSITTEWVQICGAATAAPKRVVNVGRGPRGRSQLAHHLDALWRF